jgi:hypothetical protein
MSSAWSDLDARVRWQGWLHDVTPAIQARQSKFIPATLNTAKIGSHY